jgi:hypothetical protein
MSHYCHCFFCNEDSHATRDCPLEKEMSPFLKKKVGRMMEFYISNNYYCPNCNGKTLKVIDDASPSMDIRCSRQSCKQIIEVKSKCLSAASLPAQLTIPHGNYDYFLEKMEENLDVLVVIYSIQRVKKTIEIRRVLYLSNRILKNPELVSIERRKDSSLSLIQIFDQEKMPKVDMPKETRIYCFEKEFQDFKKLIV